MSSINSSRLGLTLSLAAGLALGACATPPIAPSAAASPSRASLDATQQRGHDFAVRRCAGCHAVGLDDAGPAAGPAFYKLARRYNALSLERRFAEISDHGFERMPPVEFSRAEAEDLIAYMDTLH